MKKEKMRKVLGFEKKQRGCQYCADMKLGRFDGESRTCCPFAVCPYHVLDKYKSYEDFMASEDSKILVNEFFSTIASCYDLAMPRTPNRGFSDGDSRVNL